MTSSLLAAFHSFSEAAGSLETSYRGLRAEVTRLRRELEETNSGLTESLEENRRIREHLDRILEALPCGVLVAGDNGEVSRVNPEAQRLLGLGAAEGFRIQDLAETARALLERARNSPGEQEESFYAGAGSQWLAARHAPIAAAGASVFILRDVSERKRLEQAREKLRREQALAEMSAVLAHEIRNPLGSMELFAGLLAEAELSGECRDWVEHLRAGLRTLAATVNNVLHFHCLPAPERVPVDLGALLDSAREFILPLARQGRVEILVQNAVEGVLIAADRHRLEQVLLNLVLNAVRAMPGGGWIRMAGHKLADAVTVIVADTGPGIAPENIKRIFEPGFSTRPGSAGLGLAVCRKIVEQHGGSIEAASRPGEGATFTITLPCMPCTALEPASTRTGRETARLAALASALQGAQ